MATQPTSLPVARLLLPLVVAIVGCSDGGTDPGDGGALSEILTAVVVPEAGIEATFHTGDPPPAAAGPNITVTNRTAFIPGGTGLVEINANQLFSRIVVTMDERAGHYVLDLPQAVSQTLLGLSLAQTLDDTQLSIDVAAGIGTTVGNYTASLLSIVEVGTGDVQVNVSWDAPSDVDLHVVDPSGEEIYYGNAVADSGGELDLDSNAACGIDGTNAENVTFQNAPRGTYIVRLDYWHSCGVSHTNWVVTVRVRGQPARTFSGTFTGEGDQGGRGDGQQITTFTF